MCNMAAQLGKRSIKLLDQCAPEIIKLITEAAKDSPIDFIITCGHRTKEEQDAAYASGNSKLKWPQSKHNSYPSNAVDVIPYPVDWKDIGRFKILWKHIMDTAVRLDIKIRSGADFNMNGDTTDDRFKDWPHYELR